MIAVLTQGETPGFTVGARREKYYVQGKIL